MTSANASPAKAAALRRPRRRTREPTRPAPHAARCLPQATGVFRFPTGNEGKQGAPNPHADQRGYHVRHRVIDDQGVVPQHRERIFLVGFRERRHFEFQEFPAEGRKLESILDADVSDKYTLTDQLWKTLAEAA
jgi:hypothetical protein